jgi:hypothetical protein
MQSGIPLNEDDMKSTATRLPALIMFFTLAACAAPVEQGQQVVAQGPAPPPPISSEVFFYPNHGQPPAQQDRDRYECYLWARQQTGFEPSAPHLAPHQRLRVVPRPPAGQDTVAGALTGAAVGAVIGSPHNTGEGAIIGAMAGATLGAISDAARQQNADALQSSYDQQAARLSAEQYAELDRQSRNYRRAMAACLEGRGYSVR